ncbi:MAG: hypothetical protein ACYC3L_08505 [Gemmatimonadaceae bacterium]
MKITRIALLSALALTSAIAACKGDKVQPDGAADSASAMSPEQREAKAAEDYKAKQAAFADSVLKNSSTTKTIVDKLGKGYEVGTVAMRDSIVARIGTTPQCYKDGKNIDPYLAGTVSFYIHLNPAGSDLIRVQESQWTSQAGNVTDKCLNEAARQWKLPMGMGKQAAYVVQIQFK